MPISFGQFSICVIAAGFFFPAEDDELVWIGLCAAAMTAVVLVAAIRQRAGLVLALFAGVGCALVIFESAERLYRFHDVTDSLAAEVTRHPARHRTAGGEVN